jgi:aminopeptidase N
VYEKGAEVVRVAQNLMGAAAFRRGCDRFFDDNDGRAATVEDFVAAMASAAPRLALPEAMPAWYNQSGTPRVTVGALSRVEGGGGGGRYRFTVSQSRTAQRRHEPGGGVGAPLPLLMPLRLGLLSARTRRPLRLARVAVNGAAVADALRDSGAEAMVALRDWESEVEVEAEAEAETRRGGGEEESALPVLSAFRGFSAPVELERGLSASQLLLLAAADPDPFTRWDCAQGLLSRAIEAEYRALRAAASQPPLAAASPLPPPPPACGLAGRT